MYDVVVVGGGPAGVTAALRARELGVSVALVERGNLGGTCTNDGCVPTRMLAHAARLVRDADQYAAYGLRGDRPAVDFGALIARTHDLVYRIHEKKQLRAHLEQSGVTVRDDAGGARFVNPHTLALADGTSLTAEWIILCVGGHARRLDFPGAELALTHSDVWSLSALPRSVAIVGGAATGCQLASIFAAFGAEVHLFEVGPRILGGEDEAVSRGVASAFARRGIAITTTITGISGIERAAGGDPGSDLSAGPGGERLRLRYEHAGESRAVEVERVILAVGWPGNVEALDLAAAGVRAERGYVAVDDTLRTTAGHIYAAGDITGRMMLVQSANAEATLAAENAVLGATGRGAHRIVPHGGFTDPEYGSVGLTEARARAIDDCAVAHVPYAELDRAVIDGRTDGFCELVVSRASRQVLGAHIVGEQAVEILQLVAAGMTTGLRVEQLADVELAYPTYTAIVGIAARRLAHELEIVALAPEGRGLGAPGATEWERAATDDASR
jgi:dihydrolipoamide dehydrogenase